MVWMTDIFRLSIVICKIKRYHNMYTVATHASIDIKKTTLCTLKTLGLNLMESKIFVQNQINRNIKFWPYCELRLMFSASTLISESRESVLITLLNWTWTLCLVLQLWGYQDFIIPTDIVVGLLWLWGIYTLVCLSVKHIS